MSYFILSHRRFHSFAELWSGAGYAESRWVGLPECISKTERGLRNELEHLPNMDGDAPRLACSEASRKRVASRNGFSISVSLTRRWPVRCSSLATLLCDAINAGEGRRIQSIPPFLFFSVFFSSSPSPSSHERAFIPLTLQDHRLHNYSPLNPHKLNFFHVTLSTIDLHP